MLSYVKYVCLIVFGECYWISSFFLSLSIDLPTNVLNLSKLWERFVVFQIEIYCDIVVLFVFNIFCTYALIILS